METPTQPNPEQADQTELEGAGAFPVIGLGASAGGLQALQRFFEHMPADNGMAFVVIMHLSPQHESHIASILQNSTKMHVMQVTERVKVEPNTVYVIPPIKHLSMTDGHISLSDPKPLVGRHIAIDLFFRTLADTHNVNAVCVVLSGTGSDGSTGIKRLKEHGGITIAQDPQEAEYDAMPRNAINTGMVDFVLPVAEIPEKLIEIWRNSRRIKLPEEGVAAEVDESKAAEEALRDVLATIRMRTGHDFTHYKRATILRRIERRMQVNTMQDLPDYRDFLRTNAPEAKLLLNDLLIGVTNFFRDRAAWDALEREVIPRLFEGKQAGDTIRVWTAGCATGEEAYSLTMLLLEFAANLPQPPEIQVFATDIDEGAIATARDASYPSSIEADVPPSRLRQFFIKETGGYRVNKEVRERVLFAIHNLIKDPPFSKLDLISCRNLLIYLTREVQEQVFELFRFALHSNGRLFLGGSESADSSSDLFTPIEKKHRIFRASTVRRAGRALPNLPIESPVGARGGNRLEETVERRRIAFGDLHQRLLEQYAPPSVIVNAEYNIVHLSEHAGRFLRLGGGEATLNLLKVILPELRLELRTVLFQAMQTGRSTEARRVQLKREGRTTYLNMVVRPAPDEVGSSYFLVLFDEVEETLGTEGADKLTIEQEPIVHQLETENHRLKDQLQATVEQYETTVEELKASNEELHAINEELRSTTEELETSKEEMQSVNEELRTVNQELKNKVDEISSTNDDLKNLISSTDIATIFLDRGLRIKRFTPPALEIFNLIPTDEGRQLNDITHRLEYQGLLAEAEDVLRTLNKIEREVVSRDGRTYIARLLPYRTTNDRIDGVVVNFVDISDRKHVEQALQRSHEELEIRVQERTRELTIKNETLTRQTAELRESADLLNLAYDAIVIRDREDRIIFWNSGAERLYGWTPEEVIGRVSNELWGTISEEPLEEIRRFLWQHKRWEGELSHIRKDGSGVMVATRWALTEVPGQEPKILQINLDITKRKEAEKARERLLRKLVEVEEIERTRISRELHDHFGQQLTALRLNIEAHKESCKDRQALLSQVERIEKIAAGLDADLDSFVLELRPAPLNSLSLPAAIAEFVKEWSQHFGIAAEYHSSGLENGRLDREIEANFYRIAQEALNNVYKHARATHVDVILERRDSHIVLIIEDNGRGFDPEKKPTSEKGLGLINMGDRAASVGGTFNIESAPESGTTVFVRAPLRSV